MKYLNYSTTRFEVNAFDTETEKGNIFLIADAFGHYLRKEKAEDVLSIGELITFLWEYGKNVNFFFNVDFDFGVILKPYLKTTTEEINMQFKKFKKLEVSGYEVIRR